MDILLTESDYENMQYIVKHADVLNAIIAKYSSLSVQIPSFAHEEIYAIPSVFSLLCVVDVEAQTIGIQDTYFSQYERFVLLYFQIIELVQICIDLYNEFERKPTDAPLLSLKNTVAFIGSQRDFKHISHVVDPYARDVFLSQECPDDYYAYIGFYLCAKKIWNIISDNFTLKMSKKNIANYPEKLQQSEFYISLSFVIKKYFDLTLHVEYANNLLTFWLIDQHGRYLHFGDLSDGQQSLLSIIFTMYGYDLKE